MFLIPMIQHLFKYINDSFLKVTYFILFLFLFKLMFPTPLSSPKFYLNVRTISFDCHENMDANGNADNRDSL